MTAKTETAAEVLAWAAAKVRDQYGADGEHAAVMIERALSAQGEAVAYVPACFVQQIQDGETCVDALLWRERKDPSDFAVCPATHPAPARVTEEMVDRARKAYFGYSYNMAESPNANDDAAMRAALTAALEADHG